MSPSLGSPLPLDSSTFGRSRLKLPAGGELGRIEIVRPAGANETLIVVHEPGQFTGERWVYCYPDDAFAEY